MLGASLRCRIKNEGIRRSGKGQAIQHRENMAVGSKNSLMKMDRQSQAPVPQTFQK